MSRRTDTQWQARQRPQEEAANDTPRPAIHLPAACNQPEKHQQTWHTQVLRRSTQRSQAAESRRDRRAGPPPPSSPRAPRAQELNQSRCTRHCPASRRLLASREHPTKTSARAPAHRPAQAHAQALQSSPRRSSVTMTSVRPAPSAPPQTTVGHRTAENPRGIATNVWRETTAAPCSTSPRRPESRAVGQRLLVQRRTAASLRGGAKRSLAAIPTAAAER